MLAFSICSTEVSAIFFSSQTGKTLLSCYCGISSTNSEQVASGLETEDKMIWTYNQRTWDMWCFRLNCEPIMIIYEYIYIYINMVLNVKLPRNIIIYICNICILYSILYIYIHLWCKLRAISAADHSSEARPSASLELEPRNGRDFLHLLLPK